MGRREGKFGVEGTRFGGGGGGHIRVGLPEGEFQDI